LEGGATDEEKGPWDEALVQKEISYQDQFPKKKEGAPRNDAEKAARRSKQELLPRDDDLTINRIEIGEEQSSEGGRGKSLPMRI